MARVTVRRRPGRNPAERILVICAGAALLAAGCGSSPASPTAAASPTASWVDDQVTFAAGGLTIYATYRHPPHGSPAVPAALLIAGSGPTDRDGNNRLDPGPVDTLKTAADWLSADGVASLRYDKLGSGQTGVGPYAARPGTIGIEPYEQEAAAAFGYLARQPGVDRSRLAVFGHSEGALFALLLATGATGATGAAGPVPAVHAVGLLEPLSLRTLTLLGDQVRGQVAAAQRAGRITPAAAATFDAALAGAIQSLRTTGTTPLNLPPVLASVFNPSNALFLSQVDRYDPGQLAAGLAPHLPVIVTCSDADTQVTCPEVDHLVAGLNQAPADTTFVHLTGADHVLKQDPTGSVANYPKPLPFSPQLQNALRQFVQQNL